MLLTRGCSSKRAGSPEMLKRIPGYVDSGDVCEAALGLPLFVDENVFDAFEDVLLFVLPEAGFSGLQSRVPLPVVIGLTAKVRVHLEALKPALVDFWIDLPGF